MMRLWVRRRLTCFLVILMVGFLTSIPTSRAQEPRDSWDFKWVDEFGTSDGASANGVVVRSEGVYVAGGVIGDLPEQSSTGSVDAFIRRYDLDGHVVWTRQFGTTRPDAADGIATDSTGIYVSGNTAGTLPGQLSAGRSDAFVCKYDVDGNVVWTTQFGTAESDFVFPRPIAIHNSGLYVAGITLGTFPGEPAGIGNDIFIARFDLTSGHVVWIRQFGFRNPVLVPIGGINVDDTGVYVATTVNPVVPPKNVSQSPPGVQLAVLRKYNFDGNLLWSRELPNGPGCFATYWDVAARSGTAYVVGQWSESYLNDPQRCVPPAPGDVGVGVLQAYDTGGNLLWTRRIKAGGNSNFTGAKNVSISDAGIFVGANVLGSFAGHLPGGPQSDHCSVIGEPGGNSFFNSLDAYVRRYDFDGNVVWTHQFGSPVLDIVDSSAADATSVYAVGYTDCRIADGVTFSSGQGAAFAVRMALNPTSPPGLIQLVIGQLETLNDKGRFTPGQFSSLVEPLESGLLAIDHGDSSRAQQLMETFIAMVERQRDLGNLSSAEAASLSDGAHAVIAQL